MRYMTLCLLMLLAAALFASACSTPFQTARKEVMRVTSIVQTVDSGLKATTKAALDAVVSQERDKRKKALDEAHCPTDAEPVTDDEALKKCHDIWAEAKADYLARSRDVSSKAAKVDASITPLYQTLLLAIQIIGEAERGVSTKESMLAIVAKLAPLLDGVKKAYDGWKVFAAQFTPLPGWVP